MKLQDIITFFDFISKTCSHIEIRYINVPNHNIISGIFTTDNAGAKALHEQILSMKLEHYTCYRTINSLSDELIHSKRVNVLNAFAKSLTKDKDISKLLWFPCDFDPVRKTGTSSTDKEKAYAKEKAEQMTADLKSEGFPEPMIVDSGNGYNVFYPIDLLNNSTNLKLLKDLNTCLYNKYSDNIVDFDRSVTNASRIFKLPGTISCKGESTAERPHRYSSIISMPDSVTPLTEQIIQTYINKNMTHNTKSETFVKTSHVKKTAHIADVIGWIEHYNWDYTEKDGDGYKMYVLQVCPMNKEHSNASSFITVYPNGNVTFGCHHNHCQEYTIHDVLAKYPVVSQIPLIQSDDTVSLLYNAVITNCKLLISENSEQYLKYNENIVNFNSSDCGVLITAIGQSIGKLCTQNNITTVKENLRPHFQKYAANAVVGNRIVNKDDIIFYSLNRENILCIKDGLILRYKGSQVYFTHTQSFKEQVMPDLTSKAKDLPLLIQQTFNVNSDNLLKFLAQLVCFYIPYINIPLLILSGGHGTSKTTTAKKIISLVDPNQADVVSIPDKEDGLTATLSSAYLAAFDNIDKISRRYSDLLCIACTGGYTSKRKLYSDNDIIQIPLRCKVILNGIGDYINRPDLAERSNTIYLDHISNRQTDKQVWNEFNRLKPKILGSIFDTIAKGLSLIDEMENKISSFPRMADFCLYGAAFIQAMDLSYNDFLSQYQNSSCELLGECAEADDFCSLIKEFLLKSNCCWKGSATELLSNLKIFAFSNHKDFDEKSASSLSRKINQYADDLNHIGITIERSKNSERILILTLKKIGEII